MPIIYQRCDIIPDIDWDTLELKAGESYSGSNLFTEPIGRTKSILKTSMHMSGMFPSPQHKNVQRLQIIWDATNLPEDNLAFKSKCYYYLWIGEKYYDQGPFARFQSWNTGEDLERLLQQVITAKSIGFNVDGSYVNYRLGDNPIGFQILEAQSFRFEIKADSEFKPKGAFKIIVVLDGVKARGIQ